jgi:hypothetical protein
VLQQCNALIVALLDLNSRADADWLLPKWFDFPTWSPSRDGPYC